MVKKKERNFCFKIINISNFIFLFIISLINHKLNLTTYFKKTNHVNLHFISNLIIFSVYNVKIKKIFGKYIIEIIFSHILDKYNKIKCASRKQLFRNKFS